MTATELIDTIRADGARLTLTPAGRLRITGADVDRWLPVLAQYEAQLIQALQAPAEAGR